MKASSFLILVLLAVPFGAQDKAFRIGEIEFFGYRGLDITNIRKSLPLSEGSDVSEAELAAARESIRQVIARTSGLVPTDVAAVCCDDQGGAMIYIGLPGSSYRNIRLNNSPHGSMRLPREVIDLYKQANDLLSEAVKAQPGEDDSKGYALSLYGPLQAKELAIRKWATHHAVLIRRVLASSSEPEQRLVAAAVLGYTLQSKEQILALTRASRDQDETVRNNATRALAVLARSSPRVAAEIPAEGFAAMLNSGVWMDRNKAGALLEVLTGGRNPVLLKLLRARALDSLIEMARWRSPGHAFSSRVILGRIAGIEEDRLQQLIGARQVEVIIDAVRQVR